MESTTWRAWRQAWRAALVAVAAVFVAVAPVHAAGGDKGTGALPKKTSKDYDYYLTGSELDQRPRAPKSQMLVLMGGGEDVDDAFRAMIAKAGGGPRQGVDIVVIRTSGADGYNPYLYAMEGVDSVESLVIKTRDGANDPQVNAIVAAADVLFIAGGDQSTYIALWKGTRLEQTLNDLRVRKVPLGGTSAGLAVLGDVDYTGENGTITSDRALNDPYDKRLTLSTSFITGLPGLQGTITDAHLRTRDRMGRFVTFLARIVGDGLVPLGATRGIGIDEATAVLVDDGVASVVGQSAAYFVLPSIAPTVLQPRTPLTFRGLRVDRMTRDSGLFDLQTWTRADGLAPYHLNAETGVLTSSQPGGSIY